jgi:zinc transport system permease protein
LAVLFYGGLASGVLMAGAAGQGAGTLSNYLFGSLTSVTASDLVIVAVLGVAVLVASVGLAPQMFAVCADEDFARVLGLRVRAYNLLIVVLAAITVTTAMRTVGLLLVSALMVIPVATSQNLFKGFRSGLYGAMGIGVVVALSGVFGSFYADVPPGAFIVVLAIAAFAVSWPITSWRHRRRPLASVDEVEPLPHEPTPEHEHVHGPGCGHRVVEHGDHVDYVHDGHRHVAHADHYDEH